MVLGKIVPFPALVSPLPNDAPLCSEPTKVRHVEGESSSRMGDDGCPNESSSGDDATGYSEEEQEALSEEADTAIIGGVAEETGSKKW
jgi:hypothetical protein